MARALTSILPGLLERVGLPGDEVDAWLASSAAVPDAPGPLDVAAQHASQFWKRGQELYDRLPAKPRRNSDEQAAADHIAGALNDSREEFLRAHAADVYDTLTGGRARFVRDEELVFAAAERFPGLTPTRERVAAELARGLPEREGDEIAQGLFFAHLLSSPTAGSHFLHGMLRPTEEAQQRLAEFQAAGVIDFGPVHLSRQGRAGVLELRNPRHLNAEDDTTLAATETAVDLILLDPDIEVGVFRGGFVDHPRYAGSRVFGAGLNLTRLYRGGLPFLFFLTRDFGFVNKIFRGLSGPEFRPDEPEVGIEKLWIGVAETYAIGGACQLLLVVDHVLAARGCRLFLPARKEGIIPGVANLRLPRFVGEGVARRAIVSGLEFEAGTPPAQPLVDEVVEAAGPKAMDDAVDARVTALTNSGLVNAAANRRALRVGQEPLDTFRRYMATFAREQAHCHLSPALVRNLEEHWNAHQRRE